MKNPAAMAGSGITYAEYVHRGFAELSISATLIIGSVLATRRSWVSSDAQARRIAFAAIAGEGAMIAIAFMRIVRYEQAYGFTESRLYAQGYMVVLACASALVLAEILRRAQSSRFAYHSATAALLVLSACVYGNTDAWIVRHNVDRYVRTGKIDIYYLTEVLSADATPELIASLPRLRPVEHLAVTKWLCEGGKGLRHRDERWFAWNYRAARDTRARPEWYRLTQPNCSPPS
jgi:two-component system, OmpR family, sensor histidine kinase BaeS